MWTVAKDKIRNIGGKTYVAGKDLPADYNPPQDYIDQGIVTKKKIEIKRKERKDG